MMENDLDELNLFVLYNFVVDCCLYVFLIVDRDFL